MSRELQVRVKKKLIEHGVLFSDEWFVQCVEWVEEQNQGKPITEKLIYEEVLQQWVDTDLDEIECKCLPANLSQLRSTTLNGKYTLQINSIENIGESAYEQLNTIRKKDTENLSVDAENENSSQAKPSWEPKGRRCLLMKLTDGTQKVQGFEAETIPRLNTDVSPGAKVTGPVLCRNGILFLRHTNVRFIGGSVESLVAANSMVKLLEARITATGHSAPSAHSATARSQVSNCSSRPAQSAVPPNSGSASSVRPSQNGSSVRNRPPQRLNAPTPIEDDDDDLAGIDFDDDPFADGDDELFMEIDEEALSANVSASSVSSSATSAQFTSTTSLSSIDNCNSSATGRSSHPDVIDEFDTWMEESTVEIFEVSTDFHQKSTAPVSSSSGNAGARTISTGTSVRRTKPKQPYQFIKWIQENLNLCRDSTIVLVKACVATLVSNIKAKEGKWNLTVNINDGTGYMVADLSNELLENLIGFSVNEMKRLKGVGTPAAGQRIHEGLTNLTKKLVHMNGIFSVQMFKPRPVIKSYNVVEARHARLLSNRLAI